MPVISHKSKQNVIPEYMSHTKFINLVSTAITMTSDYKQEIIFNKIISFTDNNHITCITITKKVRLTCKMLLRKRKT